MFRLHTGVLVTFICLTIEGSFDCHRPTQHCQNGGICPSDATECACPETYEGFDCGLKTADKGGGDCSSSDPCLPDRGICYSNSSSNATQCYCNSDRYGTTCSEQRLSVSCTEGHMVVGIYPYNYAGFTGVAYVEGKAGIPECEGQQLALLNVSVARIPDTWLGLYIDVSHLSLECGSVEAIQNGSREEFTRTVVIQYSTEYISNLDEKFIITCYLYKDGVTLSSVVPEVNDKGISLKTIVREEQVNPVKLFILSMNGLIGSSMTVYVGEQLDFYFNMATEYAAMRIISGEAHDMGNKTLSLLKQSCLDEEALSVIVTPPFLDSKNDTNLLVFKIRAFTFVNSSQVVFRFLIKICVTDKSNCEPVNCTGTDTGMGRKKRDSTVETVVETTVRVQTVPHTPAHKAISAEALYLIAAVIVLFIITCIGLISVVWMILAPRTKSKTPTDNIGQTVHTY